jgi:hypothetical protein
MVECPVINFPWIVPTIDEPMSSYTALAIIFMFAIGTIVVIVGYNWMKREFNGINCTISRHDGFVEQTSEDASTTKTDIAVLLEKCGRSQEDIEAIKTSVGDINHTLMEMAKK